VLDFLSEFGAAVENYRKEYGEQRGKQDGPANAASPGEKNRSNVLLS
jgi:hypothetical protein